MNHETPRSRVEGGAANEHFQFPTLEERETAIYMTGISKVHLLVDLDYSPETKSFQLYALIDMLNRNNNLPKEHRYRPVALAHAKRMVALEALDAGEVTDELLKQSLQIALADELAGAKNFLAGSRQDTYLWRIAQQDLEESRKARAQDLKEILLERDE